MKTMTEPWITVPTPTGTLRVTVVDADGVAMLVATSPTIPDVPNVRFQSSCIFGEALHAIDCDCGAQIDASLKLIGEEGGILIYAWEEGRGIGIFDKIRAIALQQTDGLSTDKAFMALGHAPDPRTFQTHVAALERVFEGRRIKLLSNNPRKIEALQNAGYSVECVRLEIARTPERDAYVAHKQIHLGHLE